MECSWNSSLENGNIILRMNQKFGMIINGVFYQVSDKVIDYICTISKKERMNMGLKVIENT